MGLPLLIQRVQSLTIWVGNSFRRFCNMFSESSTGCWAVLQLPCCPSKPGGILGKPITKPLKQVAAPDCTTPALPNPLTAIPMHPRGGFSSNLKGKCSLTYHESDSTMAASAEVLALRHESRIVGQWSNPVLGSRKSQSSSLWAKQHIA